MDELERLLSPAEKVRLVAWPHAMALARGLGRRGLQIGVVWWLAQAARSSWLDWLLTTTPVLNELGPGGGPVPLGQYWATTCLVAFLALVAAAALDALRWRTTRYVLTDQRVLHASGVLFRASLETPLDRVGEVLLVQSWLARRLDYGDLVLPRGSAEEANHMPAMVRPVAFKQAMQAARERRMRLALPPLPGGAGARPNGPRELERSLRELARLRDEGLISEADFEGKKAEMLGRI